MTEQTAKKLPATPKKKKTQKYLPLGGSAEQVGKRPPPTWAERCGQLQAFAEKYGVRAAYESPDWIGGLPAAQPPQTLPLTNREGSNRQSETDEPFDDARAKYLGGEDKIELVAYIRWREYDRLQARLDRCREAAEQAEKSRNDRDLVQNMVSDGWLVQAHGARLGGTCGPLMRWRVEGHGCRVLIMNRSEFVGTLPNVKIIIDSNVLMERGLIPVWRDLCEWIDADLDGQLDHEIISRVDVCTDLPGIGTGVFVQKFLAEEWIGRGRKPDVRGEGQAASINGWCRRWTGFAIGSGVKLRVYDKELETRHDEVKRAIVRKHRWGDKEQTEATRVEFQVRREALQEMGVNSMADWVEKCYGVCEYLTREWFRFTEEKPDRENRNQGRAVEWSVWGDIRASFLLNATGEVEQVKRTKRTDLDVKALRAQIFGCACSVYAVSGPIPENSQIFRRELEVHLTEEIIRVLDSVEPDVLRRRIERKRIDFLARYPLGNGGDGS